MWVDTGNTKWSNSALLCVLSLLLVWHNIIWDWNKSFILFSPKYRHSWVFLFDIGLFYPVPFTDYTPKEFYSSSNQICSCYTVLPSESVKGRKWKDISILNIHYWLCFYKPIFHSLLPCVCWIPICSPTQQLRRVHVRRIRWGKSNHSPVLGHFHRAKLSSGLCPDLRLFHWAVSLGSLASHPEVCSCTVSSTSFPVPASPLWTSFNPPCLAPL